MKIIRCLFSTSGEPYLFDLADEQSLGYQSELDGGVAIPSIPHVVSGN